MNIHLTLNRSKSLVDKLFPHFGVNKKQEAVRLLFEICKRDKIAPEKAIPRDIGCDFGKVKAHLLAERFPSAHSSHEPVKAYLPSIEIADEHRFIKSRQAYYPKHVYYEKPARGSSLLANCRKHYPKSDFVQIETLKQHIAASKALTTADYNNRRSKLFITKEKYDFLKTCPCTKNAVGCGYHIFNSGFGCIFDCTYCYLQEYINSPGIILPSNLDDFLAQLSNRIKKGMRIGSGEFSDSLMLDHLTGQSTGIIDFFNRHAEATFEFKTKSDNIGNLLTAKHSGNIIVSWSVNPPCIIKNNEHYTAPFAKRLAAAAKAQEAGYKIGLHFDPIFHYSGWEKDYENLIHAIFAKIKPNSIAWISLGTLRFKPQTKKIIEARFPENTILDEELLLDYDGKLRYTHSTRYHIYENMLKHFSKHSKNLPIYLCMESAKMWKELKLKSPFITS